MKANLEVAAIIITYDRKDLLRACLKAVLAQTRAPSVVLVVNNGSSDGTRKMLDAEYGDRVARIHIIDNVGAAGAYYRGMKWAYDHGAEWLWMMDDDGEPRPEALERLMATATAKGYRLLNALIVSPEDPQQLAFPPWVAGRALECVADVVAHCNAGDVFEGYLSPFNGTLIHRRIVDSVGYPRREMFIWGDEMDYLYRVEKSGEKYGTLCSARHVHPRWKNKQHPILGTYTLVRPTAFDPFVRNLGYLCAHYRSTTFRVAKFLSYMVSFLLKGDFAGMKRFMQYWADGVSDRYALPPSRDELIARSENYIFLPAQAPAARRQAAQGGPQGR